MKKVLGLDNGGVILDHITHQDTAMSFKGEQYLETPEVKDAIDSIAELGTSFDEVYIVSRTSDPERALHWLRHHGFFKRTGMSEDHYYHCLGRQDKAPIVKELGITHFVDDRAEVLGSMIGIVPNLFQFQGLDEDRAAFPEVRPHIRFYDNWVDLKEALKV